MDRSPANHSYSREKITKGQNFNNNRDQADLLAHKWARYTDYPLLK